MAEVSHHEAGQGETQAADDTTDGGDARDTQVYIQTDRRNEIGGDDKRIESKVHSMQRYSKRIPHIRGCIGTRRPEPRPMRLTKMQLAQKKLRSGHR